MASTDTEAHRAPLLPQHRPIDSLTNITERIEPDERDDSIHNSSGPEEGIFDDVANVTQASSPHTSEHSEDEISELEADSLAPSRYQDRAAMPYTPTQARSPFRNPSSVRALQLDTTPPHLVSSSQSHRYRLDMPSKSSTPRSARSRYSNVRSPSRTSVSKKVMREHPLVLLHVTILPTPLPYSQALMESVLPAHVMESFKLLRVKMTDTLLDRGILIPHPKDDFGLLEERLLESLELQLPRILPCGHFHSDQEPMSNMHAAIEEMSSDEDGDVCEDCGRRLKNGLFGVGRGKNRWDVKVFAANGLMRAGAWTAAWPEMERVDVEVMPWIEDDLRRAMDMLKEEESPHREEVGLPTESEQRQLEASRSTMDEERRREIYGEELHLDVSSSDKNQLPRKHSESRERPQLQPRHSSFSTLFLNYIKLLLRDRRNLAIVVLSAAILWLLLPSGASRSTDVQATAPSQTPIQPQSHLPASISTRLAEGIEALPPKADDSMMSSLDLL